MKTGLVMEGGAMRGMFTCGVIDVMMENGIDFDGAIGVSAGAAFGCNIKSRQIGRAIRYNKRFCRDKRFCSIRSWLTTGDLYGAKFCYDTMPYQLDIWDVDTFDSNPMEFYVVCTDVDTGKPVYQRCMNARESMDYIRASASMPVASRPVEIDGRRLLDGGISDSVPLRFFESIGYDRNVVILTQPASYRKQPQKMMPLMRILLRKYPALIRDMEQRYRVYNATIADICRKEAAGEVFVIRPEAPLEIGSTEKHPEELERVYQAGRRVALAQLEDLRQFLSAKE